MFVREDIPVTQIIKEKVFTFSCEFVPPRNGEALESLFAKVKILKEAGVDFLSITKGAGGSLRGGTIPIAFLIKDHFEVPVIAHFTCMDSTKQVIENQLIDQSYLGIRNILALRGDPPTGVFNEYKAGAEQHQYAYQLMEQIAGLKKGNYILRAGFDAGEESFHKGEPLSLCVGAAAYPEPLDHDLDESVRRFSLKVDMGADFAITQMTYSPSAYGEFVAKLKQQNKLIPILPGVRVLLSSKQADFLMKNFKIAIPDDYLSIIAQGDTQANKEWIKELILEFKKAGAPGIQFFVMNEAQEIAEIISEMKTIICER